MKRTDQDMAGAASGPSCRSSTRWLVAILLVLAAGRIGMVVMHQPLLGVANNFDMVRVQACIDAYPARPSEITPATNSPEAPLTDYRFIAVDSRRCFLTSEALFAFAAWPLLQGWASLLSIDGSFPLRLMGIVHGLALAGLITLFSVLWLRRDRPDWALANAALGLIVLADPAITLYANSFYAEFAAVFFWYAGVAGCALLLDSPARINRLGVVWVGLSVALAVVSKIQHVVLGPFLLALLILLRWRTRQVPALLLAGVAAALLPATALQAWHMNSAATQSIREANLTNTFLYAVLGESADPARTAAALHLPARCAAAAGQSWFTPGLQEHHPCPEVLTLSRRQLIPLLWRDPDTLWRTLVRTNRESRQWLPRLGSVAGEHWAPLPPAIPSLGRWTAAMQESTFAVLTLLPGLLAIAMLGWRRLSPACRFVMLASGGLPWLSLIVVTYGDGLADAAKQSNLSVASLLAAWLVLVMAMSTLGWRALTPR